jgi:hypothetical protein
MGTTNECPPVCRVRLKNMGEDIEELKEMNSTQWEEIAKRPKLGPVLWFAGISIIVLGALLGAIYSQGAETHKDVVSLKIKQAQIAEKLRSHDARNSDP